MSKDQISRRAREYARYTGAPRQVACQTVADLVPHSSLIPAPTEQAQLLFEAEVFYRVLSTHTAFTEYPLGIVYVEPSAFGLRLHIESDKRADNLLTGLLPCFEPRGPMGHGEVHGLHGVRICSRTGRGIELRRLGQPTSLWLTGPSNRAFERAESDLLQRVNKIGWQPCWRTEGAWTDAEAQWDTQRQPLIYEPTAQAAAWLPSGLLRRIGLLHTVAVPLVVTGHEARLGEWWILELDHSSDTSLRQAELVDALTDPTHGLPLELREHRELKPGKSLGILRLTDTEGTATLQLRYDRFDYPTLEERAGMFAAIKQRISEVARETRIHVKPWDCTDFEAST